MHRNNSHLHDSWVEKVLHIAIYEFINGRPVQLTCRVEVLHVGVLGVHIWHHMPVCFTDEYKQPHGDISRYVQQDKRVAPMAAEIAISYL